MNKPATPVALIAAALVVVALLAWLVSRDLARVRPPATTTTGEPIIVGPGSPHEARVTPPPAVAAASLLAAYEANEIAADQQYKGQRIRIAGRVHDIGTDILGTPFVALDRPDHSFFAVQAMFPRDQTSRLASIAKGQALTLRCRVDGKLGNVILRDCAFD